MADNFNRNARQRQGNRRPGSGFRPNRGAPQRGGGGNGIANAKRQYERYLALAHTAILNGDAVEAQNCYQHAEHYFRVMNGQEA